jgi:hypothetical protein
MAVAGLRNRAMSAPALDHVGVVARDLAALGGQYEYLGFTLTPVARQTDGRIGNRCAMLRQGYIELLAVAHRSAGSATLDRFLARYAGIHILAFAIEDEQAVLERLHRAGIGTAAASQLDRAIDDMDPAGPRARFALIQLPDQPEGRINLVRHLTRDRLWQERFLRHPNNAVALAEVVIAVGEPAETAARFSRLVGCPVVPDPAGGLGLELPRGRVRLLADPDIAPLPRITGLTVQTADRNEALGRLLGERGVAHHRHGDALLVDMGEAGGVDLRFVPSA